MHTHEEIQLPPPDPRQKRLFFLATGSAILVVAIGWFVSMRAMITNTHVDLSLVQRIQQFTTGVRDVTQDVKTEVATPAAEANAALQSTLSPADAAVQQRSQALDTVTGIMKDKIENDTAANAAEDAQDGTGN